jgi:hypothetical protein
MIMAVGFKELSNFGLAGPMPYSEVVMEGRTVYVMVRWNEPFQFFLRCILLSGGRAYIARKI